ncbi:MAG: 6-carboxytetrahydropterin synthase QueD [Bacteroidetes bacterium]|nr:6-carboxytetrahydropterin synthase QueD [Bacteroidota bacterium]
MELYKEFSFEAAHFLPKVADDHKCKKMHGHSYKVIVYINGPIDLLTGWVMDFADLNRAFQPILSQIDHTVLNNVEGLENPTVECLTVWIWERLFPSLPLLSKIVIQETSTSGCIYEGK